MRLVMICLLLFGLGFAQTEKTENEAPHLAIARQLVQDLQQDSLVNQYGSKPTFLRWNHPTREARTVCATFVTDLFEHTYHWKKADIKQWLGASGADASEWHDAIVQENGFRRTKNVSDIRPGDILAIRYQDGSNDTGHVMIVDQEPERITASSPVERDTEQYRVAVIDSSASGHGPADTRHKSDGGFTGGIGRGTIRLYVHRDGTVAGYAWSETPKSVFYRSPARDLVIGRLTRKTEAVLSKQ